MARSLNKLSTSVVRNVTKPGLYGDGGNLWLQVTPSGAKTWVFRYSINYKARSHGLGSANTFSLPEARKRAAELRRKVADGVDPIEDRNGRRATEEAAALALVSFDQCVTDYIHLRRLEWSSAKHAAQWQSSLDRYAKPVIGSMPVSKIGLGDIERVLMPIWGQKTETASRVRGRIEQILDWAAVKKLRSGENPARWRGHLDKVLPRRSKVQAVKHHPALDYQKISTFMLGLKKEKGEGAKALQFLILTATRTNETLGARWEEFDLAGRVWTVPARRMKGRKDHSIPLSPAAITLLDVQAAAEKKGFVFKGDALNQPLSNMSMTMLCRRMKRTEFTVHGFRSSFRQWAAEVTDFPSEVAEMALAHIQRSKVEAAYQRSTLFEKRREMMNKWATFCEASASSQDKRASD